MKTYFALMLSVIFLVFVNVNANSENKPSAELMTAIKYEQWEMQRKNYLPKIVVVDMWAMWCVSCIERFPEMVKLNDEYKNHDVQFVSMNLDDREDTQSLEIAEKFLIKMDADFDHYRMDENLLHAFEKIDLISIPAVLIYNQSGVEKYRLTGDNPNKQFTEKDIEAAINELLAEQEVME